MSQKLIEPELGWFYYSTHNIGVTPLAWLTKGLFGAQFTTIQPEPNRRLTKTVLVWICNENTFKKIVTFTVNTILYSKQRIIQLV